MRTGSLCFRRSRMGPRRSEHPREQAVDARTTRRHGAHHQGYVPHKQTRATRGCAVRNAAGICECGPIGLLLPWLVGTARSRFSSRFRLSRVSGTAFLHRLTLATVASRGKGGCLTRLSVSPHHVLCLLRHSNGLLQHFARSTLTCRRGNGMSTTAKGRTSSSGTRTAPRSSSATPCPVRSSSPSTRPRQEAPTSVLQAG